MRRCDLPLWSLSPREESRKRLLVYCWGKRRGNGCLGFGGRRKTPAASNFFIYKKLS